MSIKALLEVDMGHNYGPLHVLKICQVLIN